MIPLDYSLKCLLQGLDNHLESLLEFRLEVRLFAPSTEGFQTGAGSHIRKAICQLRERLSTVDGGGLLMTVHKINKNIYTLISLVTPERDLEHK